MPRSYASLLRLQGGWSSLQRHSHTHNNTYQKPTRQTSRLGIPGLKPSRKCAQIIFRLRQTAEVGLVPVFFLLDYAIKDNGNLSFSFILITFSLTLLLLVLGIICEKTR